MPSTDQLLTALGQEHFCRGVLLSCVYGGIPCDLGLFGEVGNLAAESCDDDEAHGQDESHHGYFPSTKLMRSWTGIQVM